MEDRILIDMQELVAQIQLAEANGAVVKNEKGERVKLDQQHSANSIRCYLKLRHKSMYYYSTPNRYTLFFNGLSFSKWLDLVSISEFK